jgi:hypothetical protein
LADWERPWGKMIDVEPVQLDYAQAPQRRWNTRRVLLFVGMLAALWGMVKYGPDVVGRVRLLVVQRQCVAFEFPDESVIFDSDDAAGAALLADEEHYVALDDGQAWPKTGVGRVEPDCWVSLKNILFSSRSFWPPGPAAPKAMVHGLRARSGEERIVAIIIAPSPPLSFNASPIYPNPAIGVVAAIVTPGSWSRPPRWDGNSSFLRAGFESAKHLRFFSAKLDANDASAFTIKYEMDGQSGTIDGKLEDDGSVSLRVRDGPALKLVGR